MIKHILKFLLVLLVCLNANAQTAYNAIATAYVTTTISQNVVFNSTMQQGGTFTFSVLAHNGGGRAGQSDTANVKIEFYNSSGSLITQAATSYNGNLPNPNAVCGNPCIDTSVPWSTLTISSTLTSTQAANVAYAKVSMYGVDGSFWAGDYGPWYRAPTFQLNGGGNLTYNPEFGPYNGVTAQGWTASPGFGACQGAWGGSNPCIANSDGVPGTSTVGLVANANGGGPSLTGGTTSGTAGGYNSTMSVTNAGTGATAGAPPAPVVTVTGTAVTYTTRTVVTSPGVTSVYKTPVTTTTYSDGTSTSTNGTEVLSQTKVASNVVTNKIVNGVLTVTTTPIYTVTDATTNAKTIEANGNATTTSQNVLQGLNYKVYDFDAYTYNCGWLGCFKNLLGPYAVPNLSPGAYNQVASGRTSNGIYVPTNGSFPGMGDGTLVSYTGTITAPITSLHPAGSVYRLYFYSNSDDGFVLDINGQNVINDRSTFQLQNILGGYTASGWIDVVAGQTYNLQAWYWNDLNGYGLRFQWDYGAGRMSVPNSAFSTGWITETTTVDTTGSVYSNSSVIDMSGTSVSMYPDYVTTDNQSPLSISDGAGSSGIIVEQQTKIDNANALKSTFSNNIVLIEQIGDNNSITVLQKSNNNAFKGIGQGRAKIEGDGNSVTARQGDPLGSNSGRNAIELSVVGNNNTLNLNQGTNTDGTYNNSDSNNHHLTLDVYGYSNQITTQQTDSSNSATGHFMEATVNGNSNVLDLRQHSTGKVLFANINGSNNAATVVQKDQGNHYLDLKLTNGATATIVQEGNTTNNATIDLTNAGGRPNLDLIQSGGKNISVQQSCTNPAGCTTVIRQQ